MVGGSFDGLLRNVHHLVIKEKVKVLEVIAGIESSNSYHIFDLNNPNIPILKAKEDSNFFERQIVGGGMRGLFFRM